MSEQKRAVILLIFRNHRSGCRVSYEVLRHRVEAGFMRDDGGLGQGSSSEGRKK